MSSDKSNELPIVSPTELGLIRTYLSVIKETECPTNFLRWGIISALGAVMARRVYFRFGNSRIYPNMFIFLVGVAASKKSTAINLAKDVLNDIGYANFSAAKTSGGKLIEDWGLRNKSFAAAFEDDSDCAGSQLYVMEDEMLNFMGQSNLDLVTMLTTLYDKNGEYKVAFKGSGELSIFDPCLNILGGFTHLGLQAALPYEASTAGFLSRTLLVCCDPTEVKISWPDELDRSDFEAIAVGLKRIKEFRGEIAFTTETKKVCSEIYNTWTGLADSKLVSYNGRRYIHMLKLSMIVAVSYFSDKVLPHHVVEANTILTYTEGSMHVALSEFGESRNSRAVQQIMYAVNRSKGKGMTTSELYALVHADLDNYNQFTTLMTGLGKANKLILNNGYALPVMARVNADAIHTNFKEYIHEYVEAENLFGETPYTPDFAAAFKVD